MAFQAKSMPEDTAAHGQVLAFPNVSTCVAVVVKLPGELVGWHVTMRTLAEIDERKAVAQGAAKFIEYAAAATAADSLFIIGHVENHDPVALRDWIMDKLGVQMRTLCYDITSHKKAKVGGEYTIFAWHKGEGDPEVAFKKSTKTTIGNLQGGDRTPPKGLPPLLARGYLAGHNMDADFEVKSIHALRRNFVNL